MNKKGKKLIKRVFALMLALVISVPAADYGALLNVEAAEAEISVLESKGYEEGAYVEWSPVTGADGYMVYVSQDQNDWIQLDDELIRRYETYYRADALGLTADTWYVKIEAVILNANKEKVDTVAEKVEAVTVTAHDRSGYAWEGYETAAAGNENENTPGAYKKDGSLKDGAKVIYVTNANKDDVSLALSGAGETFIGLQKIFNGYKQGKETAALAVRIIGNVDDFAVLDRGDIAIENGKKTAAGITIEGVGEDAVANGWGIRIDNASNIEVRNMGFMNCNSVERDNVSAELNNTHVWVHNCDFFYGEAGSDEDQKKGDGMLDCKKSDWITFSYNHFWDSGKSCLLGLEENSNEYHATYHHNWFDHSDSRHPRVRFYTTHVYNNYYDGNSKYGIGGAAGGASIFVENNYFRNCKYPMVISMQGSEGGKSLSNEDGSIIKAYGNYMEGQTSFVPYTSDVTENVNSDTEEIIDREDMPSSDEDSLLEEDTAADTDEDDIFGEDAAAEDVVDATENVSLNIEGITNGEDMLSFGTDSFVDENYASVKDAADVTENASLDIEAAIDKEDVPLDDTASLPSEENTSPDKEAAIDTEDIIDGEDVPVPGADSFLDEENVADVIENVNSDSADLNDEAEVLDDVSATGSSVDFDAYMAAARNEIVPDTVKSKQGEHTYNNFDTAADFYQYTPDSVEDVPDIVKAKAGRVNGGDFKWTFTDDDDKSYALNQGLKDKCTNYTSALVSVGGVSNATATVYYTVTLDPNNGEDIYYVRAKADSLLDVPAAPGIIPNGKVSLDGWYDGYRKWNFENSKVTRNVTLVGKWLAEGETASGYGVTPIGTETVIHSFVNDGMDSPYFEISGELNTKNGSSGAYKDLQYSNVRGRLTMGGGATVKFTTTTSAKLVLLLNVGTNKSHYIDNNNAASHNTVKSDNGIIETTIQEGSYTITGKDTDYLYAIIVIPDGSEFISVPQPYSITIDLDGGTSTVVSPLSISKGYSITKKVLPNPIKEEYTFKGWIDEDGNDVILPYEPVKDMTLKATWKQAEIYTITIDLDGGESTTIPAFLTVRKGNR